MDFEWAKDLFGPFRRMIPQLLDLKRFWVREVGLLHDFNLARYLIFNSWPKESKKSRSPGKKRSLF